MSLDIHSGKTTVPVQLIIRSPKANNNAVQLPYGHSMLAIRSDVDHENVVVGNDAGLLASGGYPWTVLPVELRNEYMKALEKASVNSDISDFTKVIAGLVSQVKP